MPRWPGDPAPEFAPVSSLEGNGFFLRRFTLGEHSGTHLNAPGSFHPGGLTVDAFPAQSLVAPAVVLDTSAAASADPDYLLATGDVLVWEEAHGAVPAGSLVLLHTGWQARWDAPKEYLGLDAQGKAHFPGFGLAAARLLLEERGAAGLGVDTYGVDGGADNTFAVNRLALARPRLVLECLANLDQLPATGAVVVVGRLPLQGGSGSPASVLALVP
jgi:kynurenine formamidase